MRQFDAKRAGAKKGICRRARRPEAGRNQSQAEVVCRFGVEPEREFSEQFVTDGANVPQGRIAPFPWSLESGRIFVAN